MVLAKITEQEGFTLTELLASIAILATLASLVATSITGVGDQAQTTQLAGDRIALALAADRFVVESFPSTFPVVSLVKSPDFLKPSSDLGVRLIDFDSAVSQDPTRTFVPNFIKGIPVSSALVSWRIDTVTSSVFFARDDAKLVRPAESRLNASAADTGTGSVSDYTFEIIMKKGQAGIETLIIHIPAGYAIGGQSTSEGTKLGQLTIKFSTDNVWKPGRSIQIFADLVSTGKANEWKLVVDYSSSKSTEDQFLVRDGSTRVHIIKTVPPTSAKPGKMTLIMDRGNDADENDATETWSLKLFGTVGESPQRSNFITNPSVGGVYRWLAVEHTTIDIDDFFHPVVGNRAVFVGSQFN